MIKSRTIDITKVNLTSEEMNRLRAEIFKKPAFEDVADEMRNLVSGKIITMPKMNKYYFFEERTKAVAGGHECDSPFYAIVESDDHFKFVYAQTRRYFEKYIKREDDIIHLMISHGQCFSNHHIPSLFKLEVALRIMKKYDVNGRVFDYSCGWGNRLVSALSLGIEYYGVDTNPNLCKLLDQCAQDFKRVTEREYLTTDIRCCGSEIEIPDFVGKMGLCFSSPPYFNLEKYNGEGSCTNIENYDTWLEKYMRPTIRNCKAYLVDGGYFVCNIKNYGKTNMYDDTLRIAKEEGLEYISEEDYIVKKRGATQKRSPAKPNEKMMVFKKKREVT